MIYSLTRLVHRHLCICCLIGIGIFLSTPKIILGNPHTPNIESLSNGELSNVFGDKRKTSEGVNNDVRNSRLTSRLSGTTNNLTVLPSTYKWTGAIDSSWSNPGNWDSNMVPNGLQNVEIPNVGTYPIATGIQVTIGTGDTLIIKSGATLQIQTTDSASNSLLNSGVVLIEEGALLLADGSSTDAIVNTSTGLFINDGSIKLGTQTGMIGNAGIWNTGSGAVFINSGVIEIKHTGKISPSVGRGIANHNSEFTNNGGLIIIDSVTSEGIYNLGASSMFLNSSGTIELGLSGGLSQSGLYNEGVFKNKANLVIKKPGVYGIYNDIGSQLDNIGGIITIDSTGNIALYNEEGTILNDSSGIIQLGVESNIANHGFVNHGTVQNYSTILLDNALLDGIRCNNTSDFENIGGYISIYSTGQSNIAVIDASSTFTNSNGGIIELFTAGYDNLFTRGLLENLSGGYISCNDAGQQTLELNSTGSCMNGDCSSIVGDNTVEVESGLTLTNDGFIHADDFTIAGTFDNTNGFVYDASMVFSCVTNGGICLNFPMQHQQFVGDLNMNDTAYCEGDLGDFDCSGGPIHYVSNSFDDGPGSLRWAIACASSGDTILFDETTNFEPIQLSTGKIDITKNLTFIGNGAYLTYVDGYLNDSSRIFSIFDYAQVSFYGMTFQNGGGSNFTENGGCILMDDSASVKINSSMFSWNSCYGLGGVFYATTESNLEVVNSEFTYNSADNASVFFSAGGSIGTFTQCLMHSNSSNQSLGVMFNYAPGKLYVNQSTITNNDCNNGAAILIDGDLEIYNSIVTNNNGPDIYTQFAGTITAENILLGAGHVTIGTNGIITGDPMFVDTANHNYHLSFGSPCLNSGKNTLIPIDSCDIDGDSNMSEQIDIDLAGGPRIENDTVDMGVFEGYKVEVTFRVDMNKEAIDPEGVFVSGDFQHAIGFPSDWIPGVIMLVDSTDDNIYETTLELENINEGDTVQFKYLNGPSGWEGISPDCGVNTTGFYNRYFIYPASPTLSLPVVCMNLCSPCNDSCSMAQQVYCTDTIYGSTEAATLQSGITCVPFNFDFAPGVWYQILGTGGLIRINTRGPATNFDTQLGVYRGTCDELKCLAVNDDYFDLQSNIVFGSAKDSLYYIYVTGWDNRKGSFQLNISCDDPCPDDLILSYDLQPLAGKYSAKNSITVDAYGGGFSWYFTDVTLNAPSILVKPSYDLQLGATFETDNTGCE